MKLQSVLLSLFLLFTFWIPAHADDAAGQRVILVLDASGSMRAKINGKAKIDIAKDVVSQIVGAWNPQDELGLVVYGHRKKGDCADIETVKEPGPLKAEDYMAAVRAIQPKGQTPMTEAVKQAAEALSYTEKKATVILVSDGIETCNADPCAVADDLAKTGAQLRIHTVGFGLDDKGAVAQLKCLADKTGGTFTIANNADDLLKALQKTVKAQPAPPAPMPKAPPPDPLNVTAHALLAAGVEIPAGVKINWEVRKPNNADGTPGETVNYAYVDDWKIHLDPGSYVMKVTAGDASIEQPFTVEADKPVKLNLIVNAGAVNFSAMIDDTNKLTDDGAFWEVTTPEGKSVSYAYAAKQSFVLAAGNYTVHLKLGEASVEAPVTVKAGETHDQVVNFGAGKLIVQAVFAPNGDPVQNGQSFEVHKPDKDGQPGQSVTTLYEPKSQFTLPAGSYVVRMEVGIAMAEQPVEIKAGQTVNVTVNANAGYLAGSATGATRWVINAGKVGIDGQRKSLSTTYDPKLNLAVNAGSYQVQAFKSDDSLIGEKLIEVKAGERAEFTLP